MSLALRLGSEQVTRRFDFLPRCDCFLFWDWPCRTASVVPMMAGHAAIDVMIPSTMINEVEFNVLHDIL